MDELELNIDTVSSADANLEVEGAEAQIEDIQNRYPDEDYRTPEEQALEAEQLATPEGTAEEVAPVEEEAQPVEPEVVEEPVTYSPNRFQEDPTTGLVNVEEVLATGVDPTKLTALIFWFVKIASTTSLSPFTTLKTPSGRPAS